MKRELIKEAETVEQAVELAAAEWGVSKEEVTVEEVLQQPQKKTLGLFGGADAKVRLSYEPAVSPANVAKDFLLDILAKMGVTDVEVEMKEEENHCTLTLQGEDLGFIIGRRGETLDALQYITGLVANRVENAYYRVSVDIGNYREKRESTLSGLAHKHAVQAAKNGRKTSLEPMNPYERRIIHTAVQKVEGATSWSVGSEPNRHVVIGPSEDNPVKDRSPRNNNRRGGKHDGEKRQKRDENYTVERPVREVRQFVPRSDRTNHAEDFAPPERTHSETESTATLYGRIDL